MKSLSHKVIKNLKSIFKNVNINLHEPELNNIDLMHIRKCFNSGMISTAGLYVSKFENEIKKITKSKYVVSVSNGTVGLFISLKVAGIGYKDEVLIPAVTFVATANAVAQCNATPHFVDIEKKSFGIDVNKLEKYLIENTYLKNNQCFNKKTKRKIKAIMPVHVFGHPCEITKIMKVAKKFRLIVIEDAAEAIGSYFKNKHVGNFGLMGVFSFNGNKIVTCGGGGAIITNNFRLYKKIKHLCTTAKVAHKWKYVHNEVAYNFRLPALNAALGYSQLLKLKFFIKKKLKLYEIYKKKFWQIKDIEIMTSSKYCKSNYWLQTMILSKKTQKFKSKIISDCHKSGIKVRPLWDIIPTLKMYKNCPKMNLDNSKDVYYSVINLPSSSSIIK
jgi:perosamine synthetase